MTTYKLHYFNLKGRAELSRFLFTVAQVPFEDIRYGNPNFGVQGLDFDTLKASGKLPFDQVPLLEVHKHGHVTYIAQSHAIERYLCRSFGLMGVNEEEAGVIESIGEGLRDIMLPFMTAVFNPNQEEKGTQLGNFFGTHLPKHVAFINRFAEKNNGNGHLVGDKLSGADVAFFAVMHNLHGANPEVIDGLLSAHPALHRVYEHVAALLAEWIAHRPVTPF